MRQASSGTGRRPAAPAVGTGNGSSGGSLAIGRNGPGTVAGAAAAVNDSLSRKASGLNAGMLRFANQRMTPDDAIAAERQAQEQQQAALQQMQATAEMLQYQQQVDQQLMMQQLMMQRQMDNAGAMGAAAAAAAAAAGGRMQDDGGPPGFGGMDHEMMMMMMMNQQVPYFTHISKIFEPVYLGTAEAAQDLEFLMSNKITGVINCAGHSVPNVGVRFGVKYLTFRWTEHKSTVIFDAQGRTINRIYKFIERHRQRGGGVLVHSRDGISRGACAILAYLMRKFKWPLAKAMDFLKFKRPEADPRPWFVRQLKRAAKGLKLPVRCQDTSFAALWLTPKPNESNIERLVRHTFINSHTLVTGEDNTTRIAPPGSGLSAPLPRDAMIPPNDSSGSGDASLNHRSFGSQVPGTQGFPAETDFRVANAAQNVTSTSVDTASAKAQWLDLLGAVEDDGTGDTGGGSGSAGPFGGFGVDNANTVADTKEGSEYNLEDVVPVDICSHSRNVHWVDQVDGAPQHGCVGVMVDDGFSDLQFGMGNHHLGTPQRFGGGGGGGGGGRGDMFSASPRRSQGAFDGRRDSNAQASFLVEPHPNTLFRPPGPHYAPPGLAQAHGSAPASQFETRNLPGSGAVVTIGSGGRHLVRRQNSGTQGNLDHTNGRHGNSLNGRPSSAPSGAVRPKGILKSYAPSSSRPGSAPRLRKEASETTVASAPTKKFAQEAPGRTTSQEVKRESSPPALRERRPDASAEHLKLESGSPVRIPSTSEDVDKKVPPASSLLNSKVPSSSDGLWQPAMPFRSVKDSPIVMEPRNSSKDDFLRSDSSRPAVSDHILSSARLDGKNSPPRRVSDAPSKTLSRATASLSSNGPAKSLDGGFSSQRLRLGASLGVGVQWSAAGTTSANQASTSSSAVNSALISRIGAQRATSSGISSAKRLPLRSSNASNPTYRAMPPNRPPSGGDPSRKPNSPAANPHSQLGMSGMFVPRPPRSVRPRPPRQNMSMVPKPPPRLPPKAATRKPLRPRPPRRLAGMGR